jgi:hypothetical protein
MTPSNTIEGTVEAANPKGLKLNGEWLNWSQFATSRLEAGKGQAVRLKVDGKGFIRELEHLGQPEPTPNLSRIYPESTPNCVARLAVLKAASHFLGLMSQSRPEVRSEHVLVLADKWLAWVEVD